MTMSLPSMAASRFRSPYIRTVAFDVALPTFPDESWKRNVTGVVPTSKHVESVTSLAPIRGVSRVGPGSQSSPAVPAATNVAREGLPAGDTPPKAPQQAVWSTTIAPGAVTSGGAVSGFTTASVVPAGDVQPFTVTVTAYVPVAAVVTLAMEGFCVAEVKLFGPVQV